MTITTSSPIADAFAEVQAINETVDRPAKAKRKTASKPKAPKAKKSPAPAKAKKPTSKPKAAKAKKPAAPKEPRVTKESLMIEMLSQPEGASNEEMQERFNLLPHSVRGAISTLKRKRGLTINRDKETGRYRIAAE